MDNVHTDVYGRRWRQLVLYVYADAYLPYSPSDKLVFSEEVHAHSRRDSNMCVKTLSYERKHFDDKEWGVFSCLVDPDFCQDEQRIQAYIENIKLRFNSTVDRNSVVVEWKETPK